MDTSSYKEQLAPRDPDDAFLVVSLADFRIPSWVINMYDRMRIWKIADALLNSPHGDGRVFEHLLGDNARRRLTHESFDMKPPRKLDLITADGRKWGAGPVSVAFYEAGAPQVDPREFCVADGGGQVSPSLANLDFLVY